MTTKPKRAKRPADVIGNAVHIMRVLTGETEEVNPTVKPEKNAAAVALGKKGGKARAKAMPPSERVRVAAKAAAARWGAKK